MRDDYNPAEFPLKEVGSSACAGEGGMIGIGKSPTRSYAVSLTTASKPETVEAYTWDCDGCFVKFYKDGSMTVAYPVRDILCIRVI